MGPRIRVGFSPNHLGTEKNLKRNTSIHDGPGDSILDLGIDGGLHFRELTSSYAIPMLCPLYFSKILSRKRNIE